MRRFAAVALAALVLCVGATSARAATRYPVGSAVTGDARWIATPDADPAGVNVACTPSAAHPRPVVLLEGTTSRVVASFDRLGPVLANAGYCVYGLNYGQTQITTETHGVIGAMGDIAASARALRSFVDSVLDRTGARKVDIVGWSQGGGPMPRYYLQDLGGATKVARLVGLVPSNYGTSFFGILTLITMVERVTGFAGLDLAGAPAFEQQERSSAFLAALNAHGDTVPGVRYTVITTRYDDVVTPYRNAFLHGPGARNIVLQNACPLDAVDHLGIPYDDNAIQYVQNALGPDSPTFRPSCRPALPGIGTP